MLHTLLNCKKYLLLWFYFLSVCLSVYLFSFQVRALRPLLSLQAIMFPTEPRPEWHRHLRQVLQKAGQKIFKKPEYHDTTIPEHLRHQLKHIYVYWASPPESGSTELNVAQPRSTASKMKAHLRSSLATWYKRTSSHHCLLQPVGPSKQNCTTVFNHHKQEKKSAVTIVSH